MKVIYLVSDSFDYSQLVCDDAGPGYALSMNWGHTSLSHFAYIANDAVFVIDNRIQEYELPLLETILSQNNNAIFFLKIVDPYFENSEHYYYKFLSKISSLKNVNLLSVYQDTELTTQLKSQFNNRYVYLPYPYLRNKEVKAAGKINKIIIAGSINQTIYPYRTSIWRKVTRSFTRFVFFNVLKHPGYIDVNPGATYKHTFIKDRFVQYLSQYKYMLLCPSRCGIEFLKFNECAYAGCIPVGIPPNSYPEDIKSLFLELNPDKLVQDSLRIIFRKHAKTNVHKLRLFLHETRNADNLNNKFANFIENTFHTS